MNLEAILNEISKDATSISFHGREIPIAEFDIEAVKKRTPSLKGYKSKGFKKANKKDLTVFGPFSSMTEESRVRIFGEQYWREGAIFAECIIRKETAAFQFPSASVYGLFKCFGHFHGGHPFDRSKPLAQPCYDGPFESDRYYWGALVTPIVNHYFIREEADDYTKKFNLRKEIKNGYEHTMREPLHTTIVYRPSCETLQFVGDFE